eukprot:8710383-Pyramimonas_sp.AAC.1
MPVRKARRTIRRALRRTGKGRGKGYGQTAATAWQRNRRHASGKGKGRRGNPKDANGNTMECDIRHHTTASPRMPSERWGRQRSVDTFGSN